MGLDNWIKFTSEPLPRTNIDKTGYSIQKSVEFADTVNDLLLSKQYKEFQLPRKYNIMLDQIKQLFSTFFCSASFRNTRSFPKYIEFGKLRAGIEQGGHSFTQDTLSHILAMMPNGEIQAKWVGDGRRNLLYKLKVMMMYEPKVDEVVSKAREILIKSLHKKHFEWCKAHKIRVPENITVLHSDFPLQEQILVEPKKIPPAPNSGPSIEDMLKQKEIDEYEAIRPMIEERKAKFLAEKPAFTSNKVILDNFAERNVAFACWKEVYGEEDEKKKMRENLLSLNKIVHDIFVSQKKSALRASVLTDWIKKNREYKADKDDMTVNKLMSKLEAATNGYYQSFECQNDKFIRYNTNIRFDGIKSLIYQNSPQLVD